MRGLLFSPRLGGEKTTKKSRMEMRDTMSNGTIVENAPTKPYYIAKARHFLRRHGLDPDKFEPLAAWAQRQRQADLDGDKEAHRWALIIDKNVQIQARAFNIHRSDPIAYRIYQEQETSSLPGAYTPDDIAMARFHAQAGKKHYLLVTFADLCQGQAVSDDQGPAMSPAIFAGWRHLVGRTTAQLGREMGVTEQTIRNWETGKYPVPHAAAVFMEGHVVRFRSQLQSAIAGADAGQTLRLRRKAPGHIGLAAALLNVRPSAAITWESSDD